MSVYVCMQATFVKHGQILSILLKFNVIFRTTSKTWKGYCITNNLKSSKTNKLTCIWAAADCLLNSRLVFSFLLFWRLNCWPVRLWLSGRYKHVYCESCTVSYVHWATVQSFVDQCFRLAVTLMQTTDQYPESWVAMGYYSLATKKPTKAVYFAQKVIFQLWLCSCRVHWCKCLCVYSMRTICTSV